MTTPPHDGLEEWARAFMPKNIDLHNDAWADGTIIPLDVTLGELRALGRILTALRGAQGWQPIETAPHEELVVLGWREGDRWKQEIALASAGERFANGYSNRWCHGLATHWQPLPPAPDGEAGQ